MMWRWAFEKAGRWQETSCNTMWDYDMALRLMRLGTPKKSTAVLMYRQHINSWSDSCERKNADIPHKQIRQAHLRMSIGVVWSNRLNIFDKWMTCLNNDIQVLKNKPELIIYNNSDAVLHTDEYKDSFSRIHVINNPRKIKYTSEVERRNAVCELLADAYNVILENMTGDLIHLREDDVIPGNKAFSQCYDFVTKGYVPACAGAYLNRHHPEFFIGGHFLSPALDGRVRAQELKSVPEIMTVDYTGTGFLFFWREQCPKFFKPYLCGVQAHDWAWCWDLKCSGKSLYLLPVRLYHMKNEKEHVKYREVVHAENNCNKELIELLKA